MRSIIAIEVSAGDDALRARVAASKYDRVRRTASPLAPEKVTSKLSTMRRPLSTGSTVAGRACSHAAAMLCSQNAARSVGSGTSAR